MNRILFVILFASLAGQAADRPLGRLPDGRTYIKDEVEFCLKTDAAQRLSPAGALRRPIDKAQLVKLHPQIARVVGNHRSASNWLQGEPLPAALRHTGNDVPVIARSLAAVLTSGADAAVVVDELRKHPDVEWASLNLVCSVGHEPNDAFWTNQWGPLRVKATNAWEVPQASTTLRVAIVDTGVDLLHPDLAGRIVYNQGFGGNPNGDAMRDVRGGASIDHGTHVAGIAAAIRDNNDGIAGIANVGIMAMGCAVWNGMANQYQIGSSADAINDAIANGATVINCSFSMGFPLSTSVSNALNNATNNGVMVVCAAGNDGIDIMSSPSAGWAAHAWPIIVSNIRQNDTPAPTSNFGTAICLGAPGSGILSTITTNFAAPAPGGTYDYMGGTSMASPHVAGGAALVRSMNPTRIGAPGTVDLLYRMAEDLGSQGRDTVYGYGMLQLPARFLSPLKNTTAFAGFNSQPGQADGTYELPYTTISAAVTAAGGGTVVLNAGVGGPGTYSYPAQTISTPVTLAAFPDRPVTIGH